MAPAAPFLPELTLAQAALPGRVSALCEGLLGISADFLEHRLQTMLDEFHDLLALAADQPAAAGGLDHYAGLRSLKRTRHDFAPRYLAALEHRLAGLRRPPPEATARAAGPDASELRLLDDDGLDRDHLRFEIASRCEAQNSFDLFLLGQRFGVLAGSPAFDGGRLPLGPRALCACLDDAMACLELENEQVLRMMYLFERGILGAYQELLLACNRYLIDNGVLPNLSYVPFRNPELRHRKPPAAFRAAEGAEQVFDPPERVRSLYADGGDADAGQASGRRIDAERIEENFSQLRQLLTRRKMLLNKLNSFSDTYLGEHRRQDGDGHAMPATAQELGAILDGFQRQALDRPGMGGNSIQHLKHDLLAHLRNLSTQERELVLGAEDSDAIDLVGLLMDQAMRDVNPNSAGSQLISLMQAPLIRVVLQDKSFFSDHVHPARQMLNVLAEAGFNWLDGSERDDALQARITGIVSSSVRDFDGDSRRLIVAYEETNRLLQSLVGKAQAVERRQVEMAQGKERLSVARSRAESTMAGLLAETALPEQIRALLKQSWADVLALTELRDGFGSAGWLGQKALAERVLAANADGAAALDPAAALALKTGIRQSLSLVGYDESEARSVSETLVPQTAALPSAPAQALPGKVRLGGERQAIDRHQRFALDESQRRLAEQVQSLPIGTWFEFIVPGSSTPARRKLAWMSRITHTLLFVGQRGHKTAEMLVEELAVEISEGRARIEPENRRSLFERAFESVLNSLRHFIPGRAADADD